MCIDGTVVYSNYVALLVLEIGIIKIYYMLGFGVGPTEPIPPTEKCYAHVSTIFSLF